MKPKKFVPVLTITAVAAVALAGCSGESAGPQQGVFEFESAYGDSTTGELVIRVPEALIEAAGSDADGLLVREVRATPRELDGAQYCAVDLAMTYAGDAPDVLTEPSMTRSEREAQAEDEFERRLTGDFGVSTEEEALANGADPAHIEELKEVAGIGAPFTPTPAWAPLMAAVPVADLDDADAAPGLYHSDDYATLTLVQDCAASASDYDNSTEFWLPAIADDGGITRFAGMNLAVMTSGTMFVHEAEISGYVRDSEGNWIAG